MSNNDSTITGSLKYIWHPCSQMKDLTNFPPLVVEKASGSYLELKDGRKIIDAISSWWCKSLGHNHPRLKQALLRQLNYFEHVILANTTYEIIVKLSEKLAGLTKNLTKVSYASDGSCAVEMAMKMSLHARQHLGEPQRQEFMALSNSYHGETGLALSASDLGIYRHAYASILQTVPFIQNIPYVSGSEDPLWNDCSESWPNIEKQLNLHAEKLTAILVEPIVQGAGGMLVYSKDFLYRLRQWTLANNVHLIADECMTGIGRTGLPLACDQANIEPDFLCLSKGITAGWLPMSAMLTSNKIYDLFFDDYEKGKSFLHSHTHAGNALAAAVAFECLCIMEDENIYAQVKNLELHLKDLMRNGC